jgi:chromosome segregation ATPase
LGFFNQQAADLSKWNGDQEDTEWRKFRREFEAKLMPRWVQQKLNDVDAELECERAKRQTAEAKEKSLRARISTEAKIQQDLKRERDGALAEVEELRAAGEERDKALQAQIAKQVETEQVLKSQHESALTEMTKLETMLQERDARLKEQTAKQADTEQGLQMERDRALAEAAELKTTIEGLTQGRSDAGARSAEEPTKRWLTPIAAGIMLFAVALGGTLVYLQASRTADSSAEANAAKTKSEKLREAAEAKVDQTTAALIKSEQAREAAEAKVDQTAAALAKSEQARQAAEAHAADAEQARRVAETRAYDAERTNVAPTCWMAGCKSATPITR